MCRLEEWVNVVEFDNTWGVLDMSGELFAAKLVVCGDSCRHLFFLFLFLILALPSLTLTSFLSFFSHQPKHLR